MDRLKETRLREFLTCLALGIVFILIYSLTSALVIDGGSADKISTQAKSAENQELTIAHAAAETNSGVQAALPAGGTGGDFTATSRGDEYRLPTVQKAAPAPAVKPAEPAPAKPVAAPAQVTAKPAAAPAKAPVKAAAKSAAAPFKPAAAPAKPASGYESDLDLLARLITAEAQGEPYEAQVAVGAVVINRVKSSDWPNTVKGVIYQEIGGYYQFTPVVNGWIDKPAEPECIKAAKEAMNGADPTGGAQFYYDDKVTNEWILAKPVATQYGHMIFAF